MKKVLLLSTLLCGTAQATLTPQLIAEWSQIYPNGIPEDVSTWFKSVRSPRGIPCCDMSDGHHTTAFKHTDNPNYWVFIEGKETEIPPEAVINNAKNPTGEAIVWYVKQGENTYYIRCFVAGIDG